MEEPFGVIAPRLATPGYIRAAFVRHPIERFLSGWQSTVIKLNVLGFDEPTHAAMQDLGQFIDWMTEQDPDTCNVHFRRQSTLVPAGELDLLGRMETFSDDLAQLLTLIDAPIPADSHLNRSPTTPPELSTSQRRRLTDFYEPDFERFGYNP